MVRGSEEKNKRSRKRADTIRIIDGSIAFRLCESGARQECQRNHSDPRSLGVPHIYAETEPAGYYALGYAQAEDQGDARWDLWHGRLPTARRPCVRSPPNRLPVPSGHSVWMPVRACFVWLSGYLHPTNSVIRHSQLRSE
jgi:hypothetical protein